VIDGINDPATLEAWAFAEGLFLAEDLNINKVVLATRVFFYLGRIFQNLGGNRKSRYPSRNGATTQNNSVKFEFEVQK
jgi:hypothetical protein